MAYEANLRALATARLSGSEALASASWTAVATRLAVFLVAAYAALSLGPAGEGGLGERNAARFDAPELTRGSPLARWDAVWYLRIADSGYEEAGPRTAFFPLYPLLVRGAGELAGGSPAVRLAAAYLISLAAFLGALYLFHRLVTLELGRRLARPALLLLALFPASLYFGAPYSESLFLLASVGAFYAARTGRWGWAGACLAAAAGTRSIGVLLVVPLAVIWLQGGRERRRQLAWLLLAPAALGAYALYLGLALGDALAFLDVQEAWHREFAGPLGGVWDGLVAALDGARQLASGQTEVVYFERAGGDPFRVAGTNLMLFAFLVFGLVAAAGVLRRLPAAYGAWTATALALPLSFPAGPQPLMSLPRFLSVLFPLFMWLAIVCDERRVTAPVLAASGVGLGLLTAQFASWHWVA